MKRTLLEAELILDRVELYFPI